MSAKLVLVIVIVLVVAIAGAVVGWSRLLVPVSSASLHARFVLAGAGGSGAGDPASNVFVAVKLSGVTVGSASSGLDGRAEIGGLPKDILRVEFGGDAWMRGVAEIDTRAGDASFIGTAVACPGVPC